MPLLLHGRVEACFQSLETRRSSACCTVERSREPAVVGHVSKELDVSSLDLEIASQHVFETNEGGESDAVCGMENATRSVGVNRRVGVNTEGRAPITVDVLAKIPAGALRNVRQVAIGLIRKARCSNSSGEFLRRRS